MKSCLFSFSILFSLNNSFAQSTAADSTKTQERTCPSTFYNEDIKVRGSEVHYYIDGVKVLGTQPDSLQPIDKIKIITGGLPGTYGDLNSSIIQVKNIPASTSPKTTMDKKENLKTE